MRAASIEPPVIGWSRSDSTRAGTGAAGRKVYYSKDAMAKTFSVLRCTRALLVCASLTLVAHVSAQTDPLPSWNEGGAKKAIVDFVKTTTTQGSPQFVPPAERIATFDQDGTLWVEHPIYTQVLYCL